MSIKYTELDAAIASINIATSRTDVEFDKICELTDIVNRNATIGLTLQDGITLRKLGVNVELETLSESRTHLGNEAALTETGKAGLYGLAIGALVVVLGFIVKKIISWFRGGGSPTSSGAKSDKELAKTVPSMASKPSNLITLPEVLLDQSDLNNFSTAAIALLLFGTDLIKEIGEMDIKTTEDVIKTSDDVTKSLLSEIQKLGYKGSAKNLTDVLNLVNETPLEDTKYGKMRSMEVFINSEHFQLEKKVTDTFESSSKALKKLADDEDVTSSVAKILKGLAKVLTAVLTQNFTRTMFIIAQYNKYLDVSNDIYGNAFSKSAVDSLAKNADLKPFFAKIDPINPSRDDLVRVYDAIIRAGKDKGHPPIAFYTRLGEVTTAFEESIKKGVEKSKSDK